MFLKTTVFSPEETVILCLSNVNKWLFLSAACGFHLFYMKDIAVADPGEAGAQAPLPPIFEAPDYILRPKLHIFWVGQNWPPSHILDPLLHCGHLIIHYSE